MYECYIPVIVASLVIIGLGFWNPVFLQTMQNGRPTGNPNFLWLALGALLGGVIAALFLSNCNGNGKNFFNYSNGNGSRLRGRGPMLADVEI